MSGNVSKLVIGDKFDFKKIKVTVGLSNAAFMMMGTGFFTLYSLTISTSVVVPQTKRKYCNMIENMVQHTTSLKLFARKNLRLERTTAMQQTFDNTRSTSAF